MKRLMSALLALLVLNFSVLLVGCNTIEGAGQDIEGGGDAIEDAARDTKEGL